MNKTSSTPVKLIVFTDLDGTLLDHDTYSWTPAEPALTLMKTHKVPLILASSKTAFEMVDIRQALGFEHCPAIVENGAGLLPAFAQPVQDGAQHELIQQALSVIPKDLRDCFAGFSDWSTAHCAQMTGLPLKQAKAAQQRQFSEPGVWSGSDAQLDGFLSALAEQSVFARRGGRYLTLSFGATKADWMAKLTAEFDPKPMTMALGDAPNDVEMICTADYGVIIPNTHGPSIPTLESEASGRIVRASLVGPQGWNIEVLTRLKELYEEKE
jgi:mannosyl-3-phosphoglycerate phosphatase